jgi:peptidoglycan/LPS O-acetylase OafA/YrhL
MNTLNKKPSSRVSELDGLRGTAILSVLIWHYYYFYPASGHHPSGVWRGLYVIFERCIAVGWSGVDLFFVLSGFLIGGILMDAKGSPNYFRAFYTRRFYRIIPLYYSWIIGYFLILGALRLGKIGYLFDAKELGTWIILAHFLFLQNLGFVTYSGIAIAWFTSTWSLAVEEQFYLIAPVVIRVFPRRALPLLFGAVVILAPLLRLYVHHYWHTASSLDPAYILMPCRADALAMGMLAAYLYRDTTFRTFLSDRFRLLSGLWVIFLAAVVALTAWSPDQHSIAMISAGYTGLAFFYVVTLLLALVRPAGPIAAVTRIRGLRELGRISYCVYIIHQAVIFFVPKVLPSFVTSSTALRTAVVPIVAIGITIGMAQMSWTFFEKRLIARGHFSAYAEAQAESTT